MIESVEASKLPGLVMRFFSTQAEAERAAEERGKEVIYYVQANHTWYVPDGPVIKAVASERGRISKVSGR